MTASIRTATAGALLAVLALAGCGSSSKSSSSSKHVSCIKSAYVDLAGCRDERAYRHNADVEPRVPIRE